MATTCSGVSTPQRPAPTSTSTMAPMPGRARAASTESTTTVTRRLAPSARRRGSLSAMIG